MQGDRFVIEIRVTAVDSNGDEVEQIVLMSPMLATTDRDKAVSTASFLKFMATKAMQSAADVTPQYPKREEG